MTKVTTATLTSPGIGVPLQASIPSKPTGNQHRKSVNTIDIRRRASFVSRCLFLFFSTDFVEDRTVVKIATCRKKIYVANIIRHWVNIYLKVDKIMNTKLNWTSFTRNMRNWHLVSTRNMRKLFRKLQSQYVLLLISTSLNLKM